MLLDRSFEEIKVGDQEVFSKTFHESDVITFANLSGDQNLIHTCEEFASRSQFKKRIVHGMLTASLISTVFGTLLPGANTVYLSQDLRFLAPVYLEDTVKAVVEVIEKKEEKRTLTFKTQVINQHGQVVISGQAKVMKAVSLLATA
ncbi:MAG: MaoC family dehydratase [Firmicutes bacterium]|nr:MaoC family dehydratase [Bacillota bacterium]